MKFLFCYGIAMLILLLYAVDSMAAEPIVTENSSTVTTNGNMDTKIKSPPPSAIAPQFNANGNSDLCTVGVAGAVQTQILGISMGSTVRDMNCEKLKNAKTLYDMGMKVAAVSVMCQDKRVFQAMMDAGTPCPYDGMIGQAAKNAWEANPTPRNYDTDEKPPESNEKTAIKGMFGGLGLLLLL